MKPHPYDLNEEHEEAFTFQRPDPVDEKTRAEDDAAKSVPVAPPLSENERKWLGGMYHRMVYSGPSMNFISLGAAIRRLNYLESKQLAQVTARPQRTPNRL